MEEEQVAAPVSIVECVKDFVSSIRNEWGTLAVPLAKALFQDESFIEGLLEQLDDMFVVEDL